MVGEFEYVLLTAAATLGDDAYGAAIREQIESTTGRRCSIGALYTTIDRLESKGLLATWMGEATAARGGRAKRMVRLTPQGVRAAKIFTMRSCASAEKHPGPSNVERGLYEPFVRYASSCFTTAHTP
jgi:DNA-binding PadR family transcriptional regulator